MLKDDNSTKLNKRIVTTTTPLGDVVHEAFFWTPDYDWANEALQKIESHFSQKGTDGILMEFPSVSPALQPERPWANVYPM